jgi:hypothetical protein
MTVNTGLPIPESKRKTLIRLRESGMTIRQICESTNSSDRTVVRYTDHVVNCPHDPTPEEIRERALAIRSEPRDERYRPRPIIRTLRLQ